MVSIKIGSTAGFKYLWLKTVTGFDESCHCAKCLIGRHSKDFGKHMKPDEFIELPYKQGTLLYFCGVTVPYVWEANMHLAGIVKAGAISATQLHNGTDLEVIGMERVAILPDKALELFPERGKDFLTCRNFQFAAQVFGRNTATAE